MSSISSKNNYFTLMCLIASLCITNIWCSMHVEQIPPPHRVKQCREGCLEKVSFYFIFCVLSRCGFPFYLGKISLWFYILYMCVSSSALKWKRRRRKIEGKLIFARGLKRILCFSHGWWCYYAVFQLFFHLFFRLFVFFPIVNGTVRYITRFVSRLCCLKCPRIPYSHSECCVIFGKSRTFKIATANRSPETPPSATIMGTPNHPAVRSFRC